MPTEGLSAAGASPDPATELSLFGPRDERGPIDPRVVAQAAHWMATMLSGVASEADAAACLDWRRSHPEHERAWQRMQGFSHDVRAGTEGLSAPVARATLRRTPLARRVALKSIAALALAGLGAWFARELTPWRQWVADESTATGERRLLTLADGTTVLLGTRTALDVRYTSTERQIRLRTGEILVVTAPDALGRPLSVITASGSAVPRGTRFSVRYEPAVDPDSTRIAVMEGVVEILTRRQGPSLRLLAGQQTRFTSAAIDPVGPLVAAELAWTEGMLVVDRMRLADFVAELDRYRTGSLRCDPAVADLRVSGAFPMSDPDAVLGLLEETLPVRVRRIAGFWATLGAR